MSFATLSFYVLAAVAIASALGVIAFKNAVYSMLSLIVNLLSLAMFFLLLNAIFIATIQVLIYAGAVMVLFLFVVTMLSPETGQPDEEPNRLRWQWAAGIGLGVIFAGGLIIAILAGTPGEQARATGAAQSLAAQVATYGNTQAFGMALFHGFSFPFEVTSLLLVTAVLGAVVLGRRILSRPSGSGGNNRRGQ
jgi:NADH-quinone oxidoreductase subunit J